MRDRQSGSLGFKACAIDDGSKPTSKVAARGVKHGADNLCRKSVSAEFAEDLRRYTRSETYRKPEARRFDSRKSARLPSRRRPGRAILASAKTYSSAWRLLVSKRL